MSDLRCESEFVTAEKLSTTKLKETRHFDRALRYEVIFSWVASRSQLPHPGTPRCGLWTEEPSFRQSPLRQRATITTCTLPAFERSLNVAMQMLPYRYVTMSPKCPTVQAERVHRSTDSLTAPAQ